MYGAHQANAGRISTIDTSNLANSIGTEAMGGASHMVCAGRNTLSLEFGSPRSFQAFLGPAASQEEPEFLREMADLGGGCGERDSERREVAIHRAEQRHAAKGEGEGHLQRLVPSGTAFPLVYITLQRQDADLITKRTVFGRRCTMRCGPWMRRAVGVAI